MGDRFLRILNKVLWSLAAAAGLFLLAQGSMLWGREGQGDSLQSLGQEAVYDLQQAAASSLFPGLAYPLEGRESFSGWEQYLVRKAYGFFPLYGYVETYAAGAGIQESRSTYEAILQAEAADENTVDAMTGEVEGLTEEEKNMQMENENAAAAIAGNGGEASSGQAAGQQANGGEASSGQAAGQQANGGEASSGQAAGQQANGGEASSGQAAGQQAAGGEAASGQTAGQQAGGADAGSQEAVEAAAPGGIIYSEAQLADFDFLLSNFYTVDKSTAISSAVLNAQRLLEKDLSIDTAAEGPQILIYHTHSQEGFLDSQPGNLETTIVGVGDYLAEILQETYGYQVLHNREVFDMVDGREDRNEAYTLAGERMEQILAENPSIQVVIDLHRDGVDESTKLVTDVDGKPTAKLMFLNGLSYSKKNGQISYLPNPYIEDNMAMALNMQLLAAKYYPGVMRKIYLKTYRYNLHLSPKAILVECGAQTNTLQEAKNAMEPLADMLDRTLRGE